MEWAVEESDVPYMKRTRDFYRAQGYSNDYQWAHYDDVPFSRLQKPLSQCKVAVVTTAMPDSETGRTQRRVHSSSSLPVPASMYTDELSWHKTMTHTNDVASFLPLSQLKRCEDEGLIGELGHRFHSIPTEYSQRNTTLNDAPEILSLCQQDAVDVAILVPL
ncbi:MAG: hypothetical protein COB20_14370 [SAR86 cluster bacterium]|uniref:Glycine reductase n=1 Tax=SAR86 cluster bacterium TaxID=2030880 RepID=A0A2A4WWP4_9GAMM|nr:MAG: hypothetical protein COB20_14370 [SAR86 cluster bacterium]